MLGVALDAVSGDEIPNRLPLRRRDVLVDQAVFGRSAQRGQHFAVAEVGEEVVEERSPDPPLTGAGRADHPGHSDVKPGSAAASICPVHHDGTGGRDDHVRRMQIEMEKTPSLSDRGQTLRRVDLMQASMEPGEKSGMRRRP